MLNPVKKLGAVDLSVLLGGQTFTQQSYPNCMLYVWPELW
jgi:hypothetical protein